MRQGHALMLTTANNYALAVTQFEKTITIMADFGWGPYAWLKSAKDTTDYVGLNIANRTKMSIIRTACEIYSLKMPDDVDVTLPNG